MNNIHACVLGCTNPEGVPYRAAPGQLACHTCSDRLRAVLDELGQLYADLITIDELIPGGHGGDGLRSVPGPRSPAVDAILVHTDKRSAGNDRPGALAAVTSWARLVREERSLDTPRDQLRATVPAGRVTMARELGTLRFHYDWVLAQSWLFDFATEMRAVLAALRIVRHGPSTTLRLRCPTPLLSFLVRPDGDTITLTCGAALHVRPDDTEITCRNCGTRWPRSCWRDELGAEWIDYATLAARWGVTTSLLRQWCMRDGWRTEGNRARRLVSLADAETSWTRRRGPLPLGEAG